MLGRPLGTIAQRYDVVVVGSGYGGSITASRLARAGQRVALFERGRERWPGEFPETSIQAARDVQVRTRNGRLGNPTALVDVHAQPEINVVVGCGLGGTSLINANVALEPTDGVFADERWPSPLRGEAGRTALAPHFDTVRRWLGSTPYPPDRPTPPKLRALEQGALALGTNAVRPPINVTFEDGRSVSGVPQPACTDCGDCCSGCNVGSKNTTLMNYLPDAVQHGAEIFCEVAVRSVAPSPEAAPGRWLVWFDTVAQGRDHFDAPEQFVFADTVVLAAGTLGSTEILLRSAHRGLPVSHQLGRRFSGNGDVLAFGAGADDAVDAIGWGARSDRRPVGPTIVGLIDLAEQRPPGQGLVIEEGAAPGPARLPVLPTVAVRAAADDRGLAAKAATFVRTLASRPSHLLPYLVMSEDDDQGVLTLPGDRLRIDWAGAGRDGAIIADNDAVARAAGAIGAHFIEDPIWSAETGWGLVTVHPLGGCAMADHATDGVVDHLGRVFTGDADDVHPGLVVADGSIVPRPVDRNPLLTISALAERSSEALCAEAGLVYDTEPRPDDVDASRPARAQGIRFTERMTGRGSIQLDDRPLDHDEVTFVLTIDVPDVAEVEADSATVVRTSGTVTAPALSSDPLHVTDGEFQLMVPVPEEVEHWHMHYSMTLHATDGRRWYFDGIKRLAHRRLWQAWRDSTTLFVTIFDDEARTHAVGTATLRIRVPDLVRQLASMRATGSDSRLARAGTVARFARTFVGDGMRAYGGRLDEWARLHTPPEPMRAPRLPEPETCWYDGERWHDGDDVGPDGCLRLTRHRGGDKGPVMLAAGYAMAASSFAVPTVEVTFAEYLVANGYDVWSFDYRAGITLPSSRRDFTIDDIATTDWPAGVAEVRRRTGAADVQVVGHCVGSVSILMAMLAGLEGVRSIVASQYTTQPYTGCLNRFKNRIHAAPLMGWLGVKSVTPDTGRTMTSALADLALGLVPVGAGERCGLPVCSWLNAIFGLTHTHSQLNEATHRALSDMFGHGQTRPIEQLVRMTVTHEARDADGQDVYLPHVERLAVPILFLQGSKNIIFRPRGTQETVAWLRRNNDPSLYSYAEFADYAHLDHFIGKNAADDVFPTILRHLDATA